MSRKFPLALAFALAVGIGPSAGQAQERSRCHLNLPGFSIEVNYTTRTTRTCNDGVVVDRYQNVVPERVATLIRDKRIAATPVIGKVRYVQDCPPWKPTQNIKKRYFVRKGIELPDVVDPYCKAIEGDGRQSLTVAYRNRGNPLGIHFVALSFDAGSPLSNDVGLHGTNAPKLVLERRAESADCIRFCNRSIRVIAAQVKAELRAGREVKVAFIAVEDWLDRVLQTTLEQCVEENTPLKRSRAIR